MESNGAEISADGARDTRDIVLPNQIEYLDHFAVDIGGSLAKVVYFTTRRKSGSGDEFLPGGHLRFAKFETQNIQECVAFIKDKLDFASNRKRVIKATGGGAYKFYDLFERELGASLDKMDEMECLISGLNFLLTYVPFEAFSCSENNPTEFVELPPCQIFPYLVVNIGSGVSILKVTGEKSFERVSGSSLGGGTLWGLLSLLTECRTFDEMLALSTNGDNRSVDMLVGDIYGTDYPRIGLKASTIASSFGKVFRRTDRELSPERETIDGVPFDRRRLFRPEDMAKSLLLMVSNNIGQIAYLNALHHGLERIYFGGYFIRGHADTMRTISYAINFWSKGTMKAYFLRHEGYLGALGAFLSRDAPTRRWSFTENFANSYPTTHGPPVAGSLDTLHDQLTAFALLRDPDTYNADWLDFSQNEVRQHWWAEFARFAVQLRSFFLQHAKHLSPSDIDVFSWSITSHLERLKADPSAYPATSVNGALKLICQCLVNAFNADPFAEFKKSLNERALKLLPATLSWIDRLPSDDQIGICLENMLLANLVDWSVIDQVVLDGVSRPMEFFESIRTQFRVKRNGLYDQMLEFKERMRRCSFKQSVIFVDNVGYDFILGVIPVVRLLLMQSKEANVILAADTYPSLDDMTAIEMKQLVELIGNIDPLIAEAIHSGRLSSMESGTWSPGLNLKQISTKLVSATENADLVIIEGTCQAILTNFHAKLRCDVLRMAIVTDPWLAPKIGVAIGEAICHYEACS